MRWGFRVSLWGKTFTDKNLASWIVERLELEVGDPRRGVSPGLGALSEVIMRCGCRLLLERIGRSLNYLREGLPNTNAK